MRNKKSNILFQSYFNFIYITTFITFLLFDLNTMSAEMPKITIKNQIETILIDYQKDIVQYKNIQTLINYIYNLHYTRYKDSNKTSKFLFYFSTLSMIPTAGISLLMCIPLKKVSNQRIISEGSCHGIAQLNTKWGNVLKIPRKFYEMLDIDNYTYKHIQGALMATILLENNIEYDIKMIREDYYYNWWSNLQKFYLAEYNKTPNLLISLEKINILVNVLSE